MSEETKEPVKRKRRRKYNKTKKQSPKGKLRMQTITLQEPRDEELFLVTGSAKQIARFVSEMRRS